MGNYKHFVVSCKGFACFWFVVMGGVGDSDEGGTGLVFRQREETGYNGLSPGDGIQDTPAGLTAAFSVRKTSPRISK